MASVLPLFLLLYALLLQLLLLLLLMLLHAAAPAAACCMLPAIAADAAAATVPAPACSCSCSPAVLLLMEEWGQVYAECMLAVVAGREGILGLFLWLMRPKLHYFSRTALTATPVSEPNKV